MGTGTTTFIWYFLCCGTILFIAVIASALVFIGNRKRAKQRLKAREAPLDPPPGDG